MKRSECKELVVWSPQAKHTFTIEPGTSIRKAFDQLPEHLRTEQLCAFKDGLLIKPEEWCNHYLYPGDRVTFAIVPSGGKKGGKGAFGIIAGIALIVASIFVPALAPFATGLQMAGVGMIMSGVGSLLIKPPSLNSDMNGTAERDSAYYGLTGQSNEAKPYQVVPKLYGRHKVYPPIAAAPIVRNSGSVSTLAALYDFGVGMYDITDLRIGETPAGTYAPSLYWHWNTQSPALQVINAKVNVDQMQFVLQPNQPLQVQTDDNASGFEIDLAFTRGLSYYNDQGNPEATSVDFTIQYREVNSPTWIMVQPSQILGMTSTFKPGESSLQGAVDFIDPNGYARRQSVPSNADPRGYRIYYVWYGQTYQENQRVPDGTNGFKSITLSQANNVVVPNTNGGYQLRVRATQLNKGITGVRITAATTKPSVATVTVTGLPAGRYVIDINRTTAISTSTRRMDECTVTQIKTFLYGSVLNLRSPHTMLEMYMVGSEKVSGIVQNLNAIATSVLPIYNEWGGLVAYNPTRNPAWICLDILLGPANGRPLLWEQIDWASWYQLAVYCDTWRAFALPSGTIYDYRFTCDVVIDYQTTILEVIDSILSGCHATRRLSNDGKWGVTIDERDYYVPRQLLTPANTWDFSGRRTFPEDIHAFRCSFISASTEYTKQEIIVYRDGYWAGNATKFESLGTFGVTDYWHAWAYARFMMAQAIARQETFTLTMDVENLAFVRGDMIKFQHDVPNIGGYPCRVIAGGASPLPGYPQGNPSVGYPVKLAVELGQMPATYTIRNAWGAVRTGYVWAMLDEDTLILDYAADIVADNLIVLGAAGVAFSTENFVVLDIKPAADLKATVTIVRYVDVMYDADQGALPSWDPTWGTDVINSTNLAVVGGTYITQIAYTDRFPHQYWTFSFQVNNPPVYSYAEIWLVISGFPDTPLGRVSGYSFQYDALIAGSSIVAVGGAAMRIVPFTANGLQGQPYTIPFYANPDKVAPGPVLNFALDVQSETIVLFWELQSDPDTLYHEIRYHPDPVNGAWVNASQIAKVDWDVTTVSCGARTGRYFIRTTDSSGNNSTVMVQRTTVEFLPDIDIIEHIVDVGFPGILQDMVMLAGHPVSAGPVGEAVPIGYYFFSQTIDLGDIYEVRVSSKILGHAQASYDIMANWVPIANQKPLAPSYLNWWNIVLEYRVSNTPTVMSDWIPIASATPIGGSRADAWKEWRPIQVGDITGRFVQFRIRAMSYDPAVRVVIDEAAVDVDVRERRWFLNNQNVAAAGTTFDFVPPFQKVPTIAISTNGGTATRYEISNKTRSAFTIKLFDGATAVTGSIDISAIGYGREKSTVL